MARKVWLIYNNLIGEYLLDDSPTKGKNRSHSGSLDDFLVRLGVSLPKDRRIVAMVDADFPEGALSRVREALSDHRVVYMREGEKDN